MNDYIVTMHCGQQEPANSPAQRYCNRQCLGFFARNPESKRWQRRRKRKEKDYLPSSHALWDEAKRRTTKDGYIQLRIVHRETKESYQRMEHIIVWERHHGKRVPAGHVIHHRDENRTNNQIENLVCMPRSAHTEMHAELSRLKVAVEFDIYLLSREKILCRYLTELLEPGPLNHIWQTRN